MKNSPYAFHASDRMTSRDLADRRATLVASLLLLVGVASCSQGVGDAPPTSSPGSPATVDKGGPPLDLSTVPLIPGSESPGRRSRAMLTYNAPGTVKEVFDFHRQRLLTENWREAEGGYSSAESASGVFTRQGHTVSASVISMVQPGKVNVTLVQHGNVDLASLPLPQGATPLYTGPTSAMYVALGTVEDTAQACRKMLMDKGWQPYGTAGDSQFFKQDAVRLTATVSAAPAQGNKTVISYSAELMSLDLPAPDDAIGLQYADSSGQILFDSKSPPADIANFYRTMLAKSGWEATTEKPIQLDGRDTLIFRNSAKDLLELKVYDVEGTTRVTLSHETAAEVAAMEERIKAELAKREAQRDKPLPKLNLDLPTSAVGIQRKTNSIEFKLPTGQAKAAIERLREQLTAAGWKAELAALEIAAGTLSFTKENQRLNIIYADPGLIPAEVAIQATGVELAPPVEKD